MQTLRRQIDAALETADTATRALLYQQAAATYSDSLARRFFLTQAWVHALAAGNWPVVETLESELRQLGGL